MLMEDADGFFTDDVTAGIQRMRCCPTVPHPPDAGANVGVYGGSKRARAVPSHRVPSARPPPPHEPGWRRASNRGVPTVVAGDLHRWSDEQSALSGWRTRSACWRWQACATLLRPQLVLLKDL
jgi:hypothetical protein